MKNRKYVEYERIIIKFMYQHRQDLSEYRIAHAARTIRWHTKIPKSSFYDIIKIMQNKGLIKIGRVHAKYGSKISGYTLTKKGLNSAT